MAVGRIPARAGRWRVPTAGLVAAAVLLLGVFQWLQPRPAFHAAGPKPAASAGPAGFTGAPETVEQRAVALMAEATAVIARAREAAGYPVDASSRSEPHRSHRRGVEQHYDHAGRFAGQAHGRQPAVGRVRGPSHGGRGRARGGRGVGHVFRLVPRAQSGGDGGRGGHGRAAVRRVVSERVHVGRQLARFHVGRHGGRGARGGPAEPRVGGGDVGRRLRPRARSCLRVWPATPEGVRRRCARLRPAIRGRCWNRPICRRPWRCASTRWPRRGGASAPRCSSMPAAVTPA